MCVGSTVGVCRAFEASEGRGSSGPETLDSVFVSE